VLWILLSSRRSSWCSLASSIAAEICKVLCCHRRNAHPDVSRKEAAAAAVGLGKVIAVGMSFGFLDGSWGTDIVE
jgi:hypothetical protein